MTTKFEITDQAHPANPNLHRIRALRDIPRWEVKAGDLGGWIEKETSLNQSGNAWVSGDAQVSGNAWVYGDARVYGGARVYGDAQVYGGARVSGNAWVSGDAQVSGNAWVSGDAQVYGDAQVSGNAWVSGDAQVYGDARVYGGARVYGDARVYGGARVSGNAWVSGDAQVYGGARVSGNAWVSGDARVSGDAQVSGNAWVSDNAQVTSLDHLLTATVMASTLWPATLTPTSGGGHRLRVGCWTGTVAQFRAMAESDQWVEADPETIMLRRPELLAFAAMCEARIAMWTDPKEDQ